MVTRPVAVLLVLGALAPACQGKRGQPAAWEVGYWSWQHSPRESGPIQSRVTPDVLYVQVGGLSPSILAESRWPTNLRPARTYVATWRSDEPRVPDTALVSPLAEAYQRVEAQAAKAGQRVMGLQLDVDCPTRSLSAYGEFLRKLRRRVGSDNRLSITALLDWFRTGTQVRQLVESVDEYVPQFYDARPAGPGREIAQPMDARQWAPIFKYAGYSVPNRCLDLRAYPARAFQEGPEPPRGRHSGM